MAHASPRRQYRWEVTNDVAPSVYFGLDRKLCGIYTLEFAGGDRYVGQTVDLSPALSSPWWPVGDPATKTLDASAWAEAIRLTRHVVELDEQIAATAPG